MKASDAESLVQVHRLARIKGLEEDHKDTLEAIFSIVRKEAIRGVTSMAITTEGFPPPDKKDPQTFLFELALVLKHYGYIISAIKEYQNSRHDLFYWASIGWANE